MNKLPISAVVLTFNEAAVIAECLESLVSFCDEVVVVDSFSTDDTVAIARGLGLRVVEHEFINFSAQRNWSQESVGLAHDWVFHVDAGQVVSDELRRSIIDEFASGREARVDGYLMATRVVFLGRWIRHGGRYPVYHHKLYRRQRGYCEHRPYHQHFVVNGVTAKVAGDLVDCVATDLRQMTSRLVRWAELEAEAILAGVNDRQVKGKLTGSPIERLRWLKQNVYLRSPLFVRAFAYFFYRFFVQLGFLDGPQGVIFHTVQGFILSFLQDAFLFEKRRRKSQAG